MTDKTCGGAIKSKTFHGVHALSLRLDDCYRRSSCRAFRLSAVVNRSSFRTRKERTEVAPQRILWLCQRGTPELSPRREAWTFSPPRSYWRNHGSSSDWPQGRTRREEKAKLCLEFERSRMKSRIITVEHEVEVYYDTIRSVEGSDEDGNRGMISTEWVPRSTEVLTRVPAQIEAYLKACAIDAFNEKYNT